jgi:hypothetical protein
MGCDPIRRMGASMQRFAVIVASRFREPVPIWRNLPRALILGGRVSPSGRGLSAAGQKSQVFGRPRLEGASTVLEQVLVS